MPLGQRAIDGLWQLLCPALGRIPPKRFHKFDRPSARNLTGNRTLQQRHFHAQSSPTRPRIRPRSLPQPVSSQAQQCAHWQPFYVGQHVREQARTRDLDITSAYQELRRISLNGDYTHIRDTVKILVKERGQKPNLRLYDALLLANTDYQHGSAGEIARILDEIAVEGLTPDSATYHAALKVGEHTEKAEYAVAYTTYRLLRYIQTTC